MATLKVTDGGSKSRVKKQVEDLTPEIRTKVKPAGTVAVAGAQGRENVYEVMQLLDAAASIDSTAKKFKLAGATIDVEARKSTVVSTGMLCSDLLLNGGIYPGGWYSFSGPEGSAKSTHMMSVFCSLFYSSVPIIGVYDPEGSMSPDYIESIARTSNVHRGIDIKKAFGIKDPKNSDKWVVQPRIRYFPETSLEGIWKSMASILRKLPDKVFIDGKWWLLFDNTRENMARLKGKTNAKVGAPYGKLAVESLDGGLPQALFIIDSFAGMISDADDEEEGNNSVGLEARGHAKHAKKVKGRLKRKHATLIGTNQIRDVIAIGGPNYGPKTYEPGGNALKHNSDVRLGQTPRSIPHSTGSIEEEDTVQFRAGLDTYRYVCIRSTKNKYGPPYLEMWYRIWVSDPKGQAHGLCPVYDTYQYLKLTGQLTGAIGGKLTITMEGEGKGEDGIELKKIDWLDFKALILLQGEDLKAVGEDLGLDENPRIRERCFAQMATGDGIERYFSTLHGLDGEEEELMAYEDMTDLELQKEVRGRKLADRKELKKLKRDDLIVMLEEADGGAPAEDEDD